MKPHVENIQWPPAPAKLVCAENEAHILAASLKVTAGELENFSATLSASEKERAAKFKFELHRHRFIAGRGILRAILARFLQTEPARLDFVYSPHGKPALSPDLSRAGIQFNLAHSEDLALVAVTRAGPVGVDVECLRPIKDVDELVARFFSARESDLFQKLPPAAKSAAFFNLWTRKEALLKATGEGIAGGLNRVEVTFLPGEPARLLTLAGDPEPAEAWSLHALAPAAGYVGAVVIRSQNVRMKQWLFR